MKKLSFHTILSMISNGIIELHLIEMIERTLLTKNKKSSSFGNLIIVVSFNNRKYRLEFIHINRKSDSIVDKNKGQYYNDKQLRELVSKI